MKKTDNTGMITIVIALAIIGGAIYFFFKKKKKKKEEEQAAAAASQGGGGGGGGSSNSSSQTEDTKCRTTTILNKGMNTKTWNKENAPNTNNCNLVQWSQNKINQSFNNGNPFKVAAKLKEDGNFGPATEAAFKQVLGKTTGSWEEIKAKVNPTLPDEKKK